MKKIVLLITCFVGLFAAHAQEKPYWQLKTTRKQVFLIKVPANDSSQISCAAIKKSKEWQLEYVTDKPSINYKYTILLMDSARRELFRVPVTEKGALLNKEQISSIKQHLPVDVYTLAIPTNPNLAKRVKIRPVLLTKLTN